MWTQNNNTGCGPKTIIQDAELERERRKKGAEWEKVKKERDTRAQVPETPSPIAPLINY